ncbi:hypothetical protein BRARA_I01536 [Brassica rapa]|uniref:Uncharacterized protein n=1 Tax=Brassica campestris TaxID=3711 RepID=A0A397XZI0_BRACM|nr:hypothetical protein BRARA_I01536 [Brassica rapa]
MEKFRLRIQEEEERMTPIDAEPNNFHFRLKHKHHVAHKKDVSQLRSGMFEEDPMLITQPSWPAASPSLVTTSKSHHCRVLSTTTTTVAFSQPPQQLSRFVNHCNLRHVLSTTAIIIVAPSTVRFSFLFF